MYHYYNFYDNTDVRQESKKLHFPFRVWRKRVDLR